MNSYQAYQQNKYVTASPHKLITMLYEGAIKFGRQAIICIEAKDIQGKSINIAKFQDVMYELISCLNMKEGKEIASGLFSLYNYIIELSVASTINMKVEPLKEALAIIKEISISWKEMGKEVQVNG